ncbi:[acyl-carrier-protein] S-malonyltransferase [Ruaniaceae bacterium KH17]|nr:[acyl-carrier-protein] S-malonyltransferase [Ruaniaceae bacterium KH17]
MRALLCPGQGTQRSGMLEPWLEQRELIDRMSDAAGLDLVEYGCNADDATVTDTAIAQPLIVAVGILSNIALGAPAVDAVAGHSVGEITALQIAGVITAEQAVRLAAVRGQAMSDAAAQVQTSMSAVIGGDRTEVEAVIAASGAVLANINSAQQVVAAGTAEQLASLAENPPTRARVIPLTVAGAFHTQFMAPAVELVRAEIAQIQPADPICTVISNRDGAELRVGAEALSRIVSQITSPVHWDLCQATLSSAKALVEVAPGGVLVGLAKRELRGVPAVAITSPDDIPAAHTLLEEALA